MRRSVISLVIVLLVTAWRYAPVRSSIFVYEDEAMIGTARYDVSRTGGWWTAIPWTHTRMLLRATYAADMKYFGDTPRHFHLENLVAHLINGVLVYAISLSLCSPFAALMATSLFLLHPIQIEAVAYVTGRSDLLSTMGLLVAVWCAYRGYLIGASVALLVACAFKESAVIGVILIPLAVWIRDGSLPAHLRWELVGVLVVVLAALAWSVLQIDYQPSTRITGWQYLTLQATALWRMGAMWLVPYGQTIDHDIAITRPLVRWAAGLALIVGIEGLAFIGPRCQTRRQRVWYGACLWMLLPIAPRFMLRLTEWINEHQMYLSTVGLSWATAMLIESGGPILDRLRSHGRIPLCPGS